ncbi:hypothetical protein O4273_26920 [Rhodococcus ruber]|uniref:hypothetical protein n=1 Tax=Rhodococcus ruber TaxID=1830 RepID=UPI0022B4994E|nr:hypothetical protein [Rhodococcus ruber]MCZ4506461.1 hypothetical protein [Rhodococcus ruber]
MRCHHSLLDFTPESSRGARRGTDILGEDLLERGQVARIGTPGNRTFADRPAVDEPRNPLTLIPLPVSLKHPQHHVLPVSGEFGDLRDLPFPQRGARDVVSPARRRSGRRVDRDSIDNLGNVSLEPTGPLADRHRQGLEVVRSDATPPECGGDRLEGRVCQQSRQFDRHPHRADSVAHSQKDDLAVESGDLVQTVPEAHMVTQLEGTRRSTGHDRGSP